MAHEEEEDQEDENGTLKQGVPNRSESRVHQNRPVVKRNGLDVRGQALASDLEPFLDPLDYVLARGALNIKTMPATASPSPFWEMAP